MTRALVLANSHKNNGRCVAAIDMKTRQWIRPVGPRPGGELSLSECAAATDGGSVEVSFGDVVDLPLGPPRPTSYHPEDIALAGQMRILGHFTAIEVLAELGQQINRSAPLLGIAPDGLSVAAIAERTHHSSLEIAYCDEAKLYWKDRSRWNRDPQLRGVVNLCGLWEDLAITDPRLEEQYSGRRGAVTVGPCLTTVSLSEPFLRGGSDQWCSKVLAALVPLDV